MQNNLRNSKIMYDIMQTNSTLLATKASTDRKIACRICGSCIISYIDGPARQSNICSIGHLFIEHLSTERPFYRTPVHRTQVHRTPVLVSSLVRISTPQKVSTLKPAYRRPISTTKNKHTIPHTIPHTLKFEFLVKL